jgi:hypothetical protein
VGGAVPKPEQTRRGKAPPEASVRQDTRAERDAYTAHIMTVINLPSRPSWLKAMRGGARAVMQALHSKGGVGAAAVIAAATIVTGIYAFSPSGPPANRHGPVHPRSTPSGGSPTGGGLSASDRHFVSDMRGTFTFGSDVQDSAIASFGEQVCHGREAGASVASEAPAVQHYWSNSSPGGAIHMIALAEKEICPAEQTVQTVTYAVTGSYANVTYGPTGSEDQATVPMSITQPLASPQDYGVSAQLQGGGSVSCQIKVDGVTISSASASGGYNIADCQINHDTTGSWINTNIAG